MIQVVVDLLIQFQTPSGTPLFIDNSTIAENLSATCLAYTISNQTHRRREVTSIANTVIVTIYLRNIHRDPTTIETVRIVTSCPRQPIHYVSIDQLCLNEKKKSLINNLTLSRRIL